MRLVLNAVVMFGLLGCVATPEWQPPNCRHDSGDCSPDAVRARVIERFPDVKVDEVLACTDRPNMFCGSDFEDHEACLVRLQGEVPLAAPAERKSKSYYPLLVALLGSEASRYEMSFRRERAGPPREESMYVYGPGNLAVLYLIESRCIDLNEII